MKNVWRSAAARAALIVMLTVVAYLPALRADFVFDDSDLITGNPMIKAGDGLHRFWLTTEAADYYPLTWSLWWLEWRLWGKHPLGYHVVNVLLHAVNAVLVWVILRRLRIPGAWLAGAVFAVHPVNVATVAWISEQKSTLSMLFYAVAILLYLQFDEESHSSRTLTQDWPRPRSRGWYGLSLAAFLLALLSKSAVVMLPVVLLGCVWWEHGRVGRKGLFYSVPFFVFSLVFGLVTIWFQYNRVMQGHMVRTDGFLFRLAAAGWVPWFYLYKAVLPLRLTVAYPKWEIDASHWTSYLPGMVLAGCLTLFWWQRKTWGRSWLFGLGYFVVTLFPVLGFFDQSFYHFSLVADHWQYYSVVGVIALTVAAGERICRDLGDRGRYWGAVAGVVVLLMLAVGTWTRGCVYRTNETLWRDNVAKNPNAWLAHGNLGSALLHAGKVTEAIGHLEQALRLKPNYADAHDNLGVALAQAGRLKEAIKHWEQALGIEPDDAEAHNNLGAVLAQLGQRPEAIKHWEQALRLKPDFADAHNNLGLALEQAGRFQEAIGHYEQALRLEPDDAKTYSSLGGVLVRVNRVPEAIKHWEQALRLKPDFVEAHNNLGLALEQAGRLQEAIGHFEQALQIKPDFAEAHNNLGSAFVRLGEVPEAILQFEQALRIKPDYADAHYNLGIVLERVGRTQEAIGHYEQALRISPGMTEAQNRLVQLRIVR